MVEQVIKLQFSQQLIFIDHFMEASAGESSTIVNDMMIIHISIQFREENENGNKIDVNPQFRSVFRHSRSSLLDSNFHYIFLIFI